MQAGGAEQTIRPPSTADRFFRVKRWQRKRSEPQTDRLRTATAIRWTLWGKQAENAAQYLGKGIHVNVVRRLQNNNYDMDGETVPAVRCGKLDEIKSCDILQPEPAALTNGIEQLHRIFAVWAPTQPPHVR